MRGAKSYARAWFRLTNWCAPALDPCEDPHPYVIVDGIALDTHIAPVVQRLWSAGIETVSSCQGDVDLFEASRCDWRTAAHLGVSTETDALRVLHWLYQHNIDHHQGQVSLSSNKNSDRLEQRYYFLSFDPSFLSHLTGSNLQAARPSERGQDSRMDQLL